MNKEKNTEPATKGIVISRSFVKSTSETKVVDGKTITETKTEQWSDNPEIDPSVWTEIENVLDAAGKVLYRVGKTK